MLTTKRIFFVIIANLIIVIKIKIVLIVKIIIKLTY